MFPPPPPAGKSPVGKIVVAAVALLVVAVGSWFAYTKFLAKPPQGSAATPAAASGVSAPATPDATPPVSTPQPATTGTTKNAPGTPPRTSQASPQQAMQHSMNSEPSQQPMPYRPEKPTQHASSGVLVWTGSLDKHTVVTIDGRTASSGSLRGALPGIPVMIEVEPVGVGIAEAPSPSNGWKRIVLRCRKGNFNQVTIRWRPL